MKHVQHSAACNIWRMALAAGWIGLNTLALAGDTPAQRGDGLSAGSGQLAPGGAAEPADSAAEATRPAAPSGSDAPAATASGEPQAPKPARPRAVGFPTLGGTQFWTDLLVFHGWRIQRHAITGHCRLLDEQDGRRLSGSFAECRAALEAERVAQAMPPLEKRVVIVTHGLFGTRLFLHELERYLAQSGKFEVLTWGYASTRGSIEEHAEALAGMVRGLEGVEEISFVAHSMGGLVIRRYLAQGEPGRLPDPRIRRLVMLGTPNQGAALARLWSSRGVVGEMFELVAGRAGEQLADRWEATAGRLAVPPCQFGILAGGRGDGVGWHQGIPGDDDGMVGVEETRLEGAAEHLVVPVTHRALLRDPQVMECTLRFLEHGSFTEPPADNGR